MEDNDLSAKFEQISNRAKAAIDEAESATLTAIYARANAVTPRA